MADPRAYLADPDDAAPESADQVEEWPLLLERTHVMVTVPFDYLISVERRLDSEKYLSEFLVSVGHTDAHLTRSQAVRLRDELTARLTEVGE